MPDISKPIRRASCEELKLELTGDGAADAAKSLDAYFSDFVVGPCPGCGSRLGVNKAKLLESLLLEPPTFEWGFVHGEGFCGQCRWPARAKHWPTWIDDPDKGKKIFDQPLPLVLAYHPDVVRRETAS